jgi:hypothetical protein
MLYYEELQQSLRPIQERKTQMSSTSTQSKKPPLDSNVVAGEALKKQLDRDKLPSDRETKRNSTI